MERDHQSGFVQYDTPRRVPGRRPVTDYGSSMVLWMRNRRPRYKRGVFEAERPSASYIIDMLLPAERVHNAADSVPVKHLHSSLNKIKHPINVVRWTPEGRRCLTGSSSGEFTLWNGMAFNFETIMQAHDSAIRGAAWSHSEEWLISADHDGVVKYWQPNFNNVKAIQAHSDPIRDIAFSPQDAKFVTASDDATLKVFDFSAGTEESVLSGHNWDAKTVDWHPTKGLLVSGSKDHQVKLWDPRNGRCLTTLHGHKNTVSKTTFEPNRGQLLATCARDNTARVFDLRMMRDVCLLRGHEKDISTLTWHPVHASLLSTGGADGSIMHYLLDEPNHPTSTSSSGSTTATLPPYDTPDPQNAPTQTIYPAHRIQHAHDWAVWSLAWHPVGHILASGSNDRITRFWSRPRPGEGSACFNDKYHLGEAGAEAHGTWDRRGGRRQAKEEEEMEMEDEAEGLVEQKVPTRQPMLPGLPGLIAAQPPNGFPGIAPPAAAHPVIPPPPPPNALAGLDPAQLASLVTEGKLPLPLPQMGQGGVPVPPPPPPNFDLSKLPPELRASLTLPIGVPPPGQVPPPPPPAAGDGSGDPRLNAANGGGRKRAPLPSQKESLREEQRKGNYRSAR